MKKKNKIVISIIAIILILSVTLHYSLNINTEINSNISIYIEGEEGSYTLSDAANIPNKDYILNGEKTKCSSGGSIKWDVNTSKMSVRTNKSEKCSVYLDKMEDSMKTLVALNLYDYLKEEPQNYNMFNYTYNGWQGNLDYGHTEQQNNYNENLEITEGVYSTEDDFGISYYFRGSKSLNNVVKFGKYDSDMYYYQTGGDPGVYSVETIFSTGSLNDCQNESVNVNTYCNDEYKYANAGDDMYWRIIRVNGDGSLRLLYIGSGNGLSDVNNIEVKSSVAGRSIYNNFPSEAEIYDSNKYRTIDPKYIGYTYDNGAPNSGDGVNSVIKNYLEAWYSKNMIEEDTKIAYGQFYSDTSNYHLNGELTNTLGIHVLFGSKTYDIYSYNSVLRLENSYLQESKNQNFDIKPSLKTEVTTENYGGIYTEKVGLINVDELAFSGHDAFDGAINYDESGESYPYTTNINYNYWTMSPAYSKQNTEAPCFLEIFMSYSNGGYSSADILSSPSSLSKEYSGVVPVINLTVEAARSLTGEGSSTNPYEFEESTKTLMALNLTDQVKKEPNTYNMFNYTYNGYQRNKDTGKTEKVPGIETTEGIYTMEDDFGTSYYFRGSQNLNNIVKFGKYDEDMYYYLQAVTSTHFFTGNLTECQQESEYHFDHESLCSDYNKYADAGDEMYWRILRINGDGTLRLLYLGHGQNINSYADIIDKKSRAGVSFYSDYIYMNDQYIPNINSYDSTLASIYIDYWHKRSLNEENSYIAEGRYFSDFSERFESNSKLKQYYGFYDNINLVQFGYAPVLRLDKNYANFTNNVAPTLKSNTDEVLNLKAGFITADELVLSGYDGVLGARNQNIDENLCPYTTNKYYDYFTMTSATNIKQYIMSKFGFIDSYAVNRNEGVLSSNIGIIPVINLTIDAARSLIGSGTFDSPYRIE